jgi:hypothetical protein
LSGLFILLTETSPIDGYRHLLAAGTQQTEVIDQSTNTLPAMFADAGGTTDRTQSSSGRERSNRGVGE